MSTCHVICSISNFTDEVPQRILVILTSRRPLISTALSIAKRNHEAWRGGEEGEGVDGCEIGSGCVRGCREGGAAVGGGGGAGTGRGG